MTTQQTTQSQIIEAMFSMMLVFLFGRFILTMASEYSKQLGSSKLMYKVKSGNPNSLEPYTPEQEARDRSKEYTRMVQEQGINTTVKYVFVDAAWLEKNAYYRYPINQIEMFRTYPALFRDLDLAILAHEAGHADLESSGQVPENELLREIEAYRRGRRLAAAWGVENEFNEKAKNFTEGMLSGAYFELPPSPETLEEARPELEKFLKEIKSGNLSITAAGTCYQDAARYVIKEDQGELVHGTAISLGRRIGHAWVELPSGYIWEPSSGEYLTKERFQDLVDPIEERRYTPEEVAIMTLKTKHFGPWAEEDKKGNPINLDELLTPSLKPGERPLFYSPEWVMYTGQKVPRYVYHVPIGRAEFGKTVKAYSIKETEAADSFGKGYGEAKYVWLSLKPIYGMDNTYIIDMTKLGNASLRLTGQAEGNMLHRGDIPANAIVAIMRSRKVIEHPRLKKRIG